MHLIDSSHPWDLGAGGIVFASREEPLCWADRQKPPRKDPTMPGASQTIFVATESESNNG